MKRFWESDYCSDWAWLVGCQVHPPVKRGRKRYRAQDGLTNWKQRSPVITAGFP
jgi:hypothetical protein